MAISFNDIKKQVNKPVTNIIKVKVDCLADELEVLDYLPQQKKAEFLSFVMDYSFDQQTGCYSEIRLQTFLAIAFAKFYGQIDITDEDLKDAPNVYDILVANKILDTIISTVPEEEVDFIQELTEITARDTQKYNTSAVGIIAAMANSAEKLDNKAKELFNDVKEGKGLEEILSIRDAVAANVVKPPEAMPELKIVSKIN